MEHAWKTHLARVSDATDGARVRIVGRAVHTGKEVTTPHGTPCLAFTMPESGGTLFSPIPPIAFNAVFAVDDGTGTIAIADDCTVLIDIDATIAPSSHQPAPTFGASIIAREEATEGRHGNHTMSRREGVLLPGARVAVVGTVERDAAGHARLVGIAKHPLIISTNLKSFEA